jgi:3-dehydroquinate synthase
LNSNHKTIEIKSINGDYLATFHPDHNSLLTSIKNISDSYFVVDSALPSIYPDLFLQFPKERVFEVVSDENTKSLSTVESISEWLIDRGASKSSHLIGIGGGVVQDLSTFVSHVFYRGIKWTFVPTTLLSQADSCIGAKCALNIQGHKNQIGVIHTPCAIEIFPGFLNSLPYSEIQSGYGEIAKLAVTGSKQFLVEFEDHLSRYGMVLSGIELLIEMSLMAKKDIIDLDEYETGLRRVLNYGHSFGHALESLTKNNVVHGDAVIIGMELINYLGLHWGITDLDFQVRMQNLFDANFSQITIEQNISALEWVQELNKDKKMKNGKMNFAIPVSQGDIRIVERNLDSDLVNLVGEYISGSPRFYTT